MRRSLRFVVGGALLVSCGGTPTTSGSCEPPDCHANPGPCEMNPNQPGCPGYVEPEPEGCQPPDCHPNPGPCELDPSQPGCEQPPEPEPEREPEPRGVPLPG